MSSSSDQGDVNMRWSGHSARSPGVRRIFCAPGNPGIENIAELVPVRADDMRRACSRSRCAERIDLTVVGPEVPLAVGIVDAVSAERPRGLRSHTACGGTGMEQSLRESVHGTSPDPHRTPLVVSHQDREHARAALRSFALPVVLKADGLAAGKGVVICYVSRMKPRNSMTC